MFSFLILKARLAGVNIEAKKREEYKGALSYLGALHLPYPPSPSSPLSSSSLPSPFPSLPSLSPSPAPLI